jgi:putative transposase
MFALAQLVAPCRRHGCFSEEQTIGVLNGHEAGVAISDLCRKHGVGDASISEWKAELGGMDVSEAERLRALEDANAKLKRRLADPMLDNVAPKDRPGKKW